MNNGSGDAKGQNIVGARELSGVTLTPDDRFGKCPRGGERVRSPPSSPAPGPRPPPSVYPPEVINVANSRQLLSSSSAVSDRNRAVTFSCYTCTIIIVSRNHACRGYSLWMYRARLYKRVDRASSSIGRIIHELIR